METLVSLEEVLGKRMCERFCAKGVFGHSLHLYMVTTSQIIK
jgi:hypothetical protein